MTLTRRENLRRLLRGQTPAWTPFAINFHQWFDHRRKFHRLPAELAGCADYLEAMKAAGCDIFSRNIDGGYREGDAKLTPRIREEPGETGTRRITEYHTPFGELCQKEQTQEQLTTSHMEEYLVKDWSRDGDAFKCLLDQRTYDWDEAAFLATDDRVGEDGLVNIACARTPLKMLHNFLGLDHACLFVMDEPNEAKRLCDLYWGGVMGVLERLSRHPRVDSAILMDNVDTPFYCPSIAGEFWTPYVKQAAGLMRSRGKTLFVHACGQLKGLSPAFAESRVSGLEGIAHPPLGDWTVGEAQACHDGFVFVGGFSAHEQVGMSDEQVRDFYRRYLPTAGRERMIFAASCQTTPDTPWERIRLVRDLVRDWGGDVTAR